MLDWLFSFSLSWTEISDTACRCLACRMNFEMNCRHLFLPRKDQTNFTYFRLPDNPSLSKLPPLEVTGGRISYTQDPGILGSITFLLTLYVNIT